MKEKQTQEMGDITALLTEMTEACEHKDRQLTEVCNALLISNQSVQRLQVQLDVANAFIQYSERRINDQATLQRNIRENPSVASLQGTDEVYKSLEKKNKELELELRIEQRQRRDLTQTHMQREEELLRQIEELKRENQALKEGHVDSMEEAGTSEQPTLELPLILSLLGDRVPFLHHIRLSAVAHLGLLPGFCTSFRCSFWSYS
ncbi:hypothetical protein L7F22_002050 [Adiantum nelumboides]|nr:hypothetical protein [Adiantum nelumboides]